MRVASRLCLLAASQRFNGSCTRHTLCRLSIIDVTQINTIVDTGVESFFPVCMSAVDAWTTSMPSPEEGKVVQSLTEDETDDLLFCARAGELEDLKTTASLIAEQKGVQLSDIFASAIDENTGNTCLHYAAANGHIETVAHLISTAQYLAFATRANGAGNTALHYAALNGQLEVAKKLVSSVPETERSRFVSAKNHAGHDAAFEAEGNGMEDVVTFLLEVMDETDADATASGEVNGSNADVETKDEVGGDDPGVEVTTEKLGGLDVGNGRE